MKRITPSARMGALAFFLASVCHSDEPGPKRAGRLPPKQDKSHITSPGPGEAAQQSHPKTWHLQGQEILLELSDPQGEYPAGIYAWDPLGSDIPAKPRLLLAGAHQPVWSPHHTRILFSYSGDMGLADKEGNLVPLQPALPSSYLASDGTSLQWDNQGNLYTIVQRPAWGSVVYLSGKASENVPLSQLQNSYEYIFDGPFNVPVIPLKRARASMAPGPTRLTTQDILTTSNPTFFSDTATNQRYMACEVYPASPMDMMRHKSRIRIFDFVKWAKDIKPEDYSVETRKQEPWFLQPSAPLVARGRPLTTTDENTADIAEVSPKWSPSGEWIAFSQVNFTNGEVIPYIMRPDGRDALALIKPDLDGFKGVPPHTLGNDYVVPLHWSGDGNYLWLQSGSDDEGEILVARQINGQWHTDPVTSWNVSGFGVLFKAFFGPWVSTINDNPVTRNWVEVLNVESKKTYRWKFRRDVEVHWMSW